MTDTDKIKVTGTSLEALVKAAYALSHPIGLGYLHARPGELSDADAAEIVAYGVGKRNAVYMDYVHGRCCKFYVYRDVQGDLWINKNWYDHSQSQLQQLLARCGILVEAI